MESIARIPKYVPCRIFVLKLAYILHTIDFPVASEIVYPLHRIQVNTSYGSQCYDNLKNFHYPFSYQVAR